MYVVLVWFISWFPKVSMNLVRVSISSRIYGFDLKASYVLIGYVSSMLRKSSGTRHLVNWTLHFSHNIRIAAKLSWLQLLFLFVKSSKHRFCNKNLNRLFDIVTLNTGGSSDLENKSLSCENSNYTNHDNKKSPIKVFSSVTSVQFKWGYLPLSTL